MSLSRAAIVDQLKEIVGADRVITDETVLKKNSIDRFRKFPDIHGIYTLPIPAAVVKLGSTEQVSRVLNFMNAHKINGVPRTGASATEGGLETVVENISHLILLTKLLSHLNLSHLQYKFKSDATG